jgi:hypothetical protein
MKNQMEINNGQGDSALHDGWFATIKSLPHGEWFKLSDKPNAKVWRKGAYDYAERAFCADDCSDMSHCKMVKGSRVVFVGFTY